MRTVSSFERIWLLDVLNVIVIKYQSWRKLRSLRVSGSLGLLKGFSRIGEGGRWGQKWECARPYGDESWAICSAPLVMSSVTPFPPFLLPLCMPVMESPTSASHTLPGCEVQPGSATPLGPQPWPQNSHELLIQPLQLWSPKEPLESDPELVSLGVGPGNWHF